MNWKQYSQTFNINTGLQNYLCEAVLLGIHTSLLSLCSNHSELPAIEHCLCWYSLPTPHYPRLQFHLHQTVQKTKIKKWVSVIRLYLLCNFLIKEDLHSSICHFFLSPPICWTTVTHICSRISSLLSVFQHGSHKVIF